jgi:hypothetical protein
MKCVCRAVYIPPFDGNINKYMPHASNIYTPFPTVPDFLPKWKNSCYNLQSDPHVYMIWYISSARSIQNARVQRMPVESLCILVHITPFCSSCGSRYKLTYMKYFSDIWYGHHGWHPGARFSSAISHHVHIDSYSHFSITLFTIWCGTSVIRFFVTTNFIITVTRDYFWKFSSIQSKIWHTVIITSHFILCHTS